MRARAFFCIAVMVGAGGALWAAAPGLTSAGPAAGTRPALPAGWAAGLDKPFAGVVPRAMNLWEGDAPGRVATTRPERDDGTSRIWDVSVPGMLVYLPQANAAKPVPPRTCIIFCAGGAYTHLTRPAGADDTVAAFVPKGIVVVSLKYRLSPPSKNVADDALADGMRAVRLVRAHAKEWNIDAAKVGVVGVSAGAHMALRLALTQPAEKAHDSDPVDAESFRPDFVGLLSPWPNGKGLAEYAVPAGMRLPPAFIASARDDKTAPFDFAKGIEANWQRADAPVEFLATDTGGHAAFEISSGDEGSKWPEKFLPWLAGQGMWKQ